MSVSHDSMLASDASLKRRRSVENSLQATPVDLSIGRKLGEGSYYKIFLSNFETVVRIAKKKGYSAREIEILKVMKHKQVNHMIRYWMADEYLHMEMEYCKGGDLQEKIVKLKKSRRALKNFTREKFCLDGKNDGDDKGDNGEGENGEGENGEVNSKIDSTVSNKVDNTVSNKVNINTVSNKVDNTRSVVSNNVDSTVSNTEQEIMLSSSELSLNSDIMMCRAEDNCSMDEIDGKKRLSNPFNSTDTDGIEDTLVNGDFDTEEESGEVKWDNVKRPKWVLNLMRQLSAGLMHIHAMNIIHMDVKPSNILIKGSLYKICDFNISEVGEGEVDLDGDGIYMAPEILGNRRYFVSDVFSLGLIYLELCNLDKELPAKGEKYRKLRSNNFQGWKVDEICRKMLDKDPEKRCSASEVHEYFKKVLGQP